MRVLIVGLGSIAKKHVIALRIINPNCNIYALRSSSLANFEKGIINIYEIDNVKIEFDFAIISNPTYLHYETIKILAQKKIPLFIEKPALHSLDNSIELIDIVESNKITNYVACNLRFHPCIVYLKENILSSSSRIINEVNIYCGSYLPEWRLGKDFRTSYSANIAMGGGVHLDLFHELDYTTWLFGMPESSSSILRSKSSLKIDAIDYANYTLEYGNFTASILLNYYRRKAKREIEIVFEDQTLTIDLISNYIKDDNEKIILSAYDFSLIDSYVNQMKYFISLLKTKQQSFNSLKDSIDVLKIVLKS